MEDSITPSSSASTEQKANGSNVKSFSLKSHRSRTQAKSSSNNSPNQTQKPNQKKNVFVPKGTQPNVPKLDIEKTDSPNVSVPTTQETPKSDSNTTEVLFFDQSNSIFNHRRNQSVQHHKIKNQREEQESESLKQPK